MEGEMKGRKATVFFINLFVLIGLWVSGLIFSPDVLKSTGSLIIIMIVGNGATYVGGQVADAWQKSKYFCPELEGK